jgi:hypothetical protein
MINAASISINSGCADQRPPSQSQTGFMSQIMVDRLSLPCVDVVGPCARAGSRPQLHFPVYSSSPNRQLAGATSAVIESA